MSLPEKHLESFLTIFSLVTAVHSNFVLFFNYMKGLTINSSSLSPQALN